MVKRGISGASVPGRRFTNLVLELCGRGLTVDQIVDELHSKHPDQARLKRPNLKIKVEKMVSSRSSKEEEEEETNATNKRQRRDDTSTTSAESNVLTLDDNHTQFDMTNESLRVSYSRTETPYKKKETVSFDEGYDNDAQVKGGPMFKDLGGLNGVLEELNRYVKLPLWCRDIVQGLDMRPLSGILLHGPPGCGKTTLAYAIANETGVPFYMLSAPELVSGVSGGSEANIMKLFEKAYRTAPSVIFIDEIDAIGSKRENQHKGMDTRIVTQLLNCMEEKYMRQKLKESRVSSDESGSKPGHVIVIGATNRPDSLDMALRRRFVKEIYLGVPDDNAREEILSKLTCPLPLESTFDSARIARLTPGFVGSDFEALVMEAGIVAANKIIDSRKSQLSIDSDSAMKLPLSEQEEKRLFYTTSNFEEALKKVQPSLTREGFTTRPSVTWDDVGGLDHLREEFYHHVTVPFKFPEQCEEFQFCLETGFLLYGPPGCGKTLVAKAVANEAGANFIHVKGPDLLSKYVGDTEKAIRELFSRARMSSPCIVFFDEVDALTTKRGEQGAWVVERPLNQLLVELSGGEERDGVIVIGATNRPDRMDPAVQRAGRFGKHLYVPLPNRAQRYEILKSIVKALSVPIDPSVDLNHIATMKCCKNRSGADLSALVKEAGFAAYRDTNQTSKRTIKMVHFDKAFTNLKPPLTNKQIREYKKIYAEFHGPN